MDRPIPPFYCVYLLRSTIHHASLYVGSTPNPRRRLKQHNGESTGGAQRTARERLRPWEMTLIVTGFPSKIAALQFEWAWQNTHLTRHILTEDRITSSRTVNAFSARTGRIRKRPMRPRDSLHDKLLNLHLLLRSKSFERWPLEVRFFARDIWTAWHKWTKQTVLRIRGHLRIFLDGDDLTENTVLQQAVSHAADDMNSSTVKESEKLCGVGSLEIGYRALKCNLLKSITLLEGEQSIGCAICHETMKPDRDLILVCSDELCHMTAHLSCLSNHFVSVENKLDAVLPIDGICPKCKVKLCWVDLLRDLTLRIRGQAEVKLLMKPPRETKSKHPTSKGTTPFAEDVGTEEAEMVASNSRLPNVGPSRSMDDNGYSSSGSEDDGLVYRDSNMDLCAFDDIDEVMSADSDVSDNLEPVEMLSAPSMISRNYSSPQFRIADSSIVIPDSDDWDAIEDVVE